VQDRAENVWVDSPPLSTLVRRLRGLRPLRTMGTVRSGCRTGLRKVPADRPAPSPPRSGSGRPVVEGSRPARSGPEHRGRIDAVLVGRAGSRSASGVGPTQLARPTRERGPPAKRSPSRDQTVDPEGDRTSLSRTSPPRPRSGRGNESGPPPSLHRANRGPVLTALEKIGRSPGGGAEIGRTREPSLWTGALWGAEGRARSTCGTSDPLGLSSPGSPPRPPG
jgi:hypothetical protein